MPYDTNATKILTYKEEPYPLATKKKKKETLAVKKRKNLSQAPPKKKRGFWGSVFHKDVTAIKKRRKLLEESLKY